jgi:hypothetical protein
MTITLPPPQYDHPYEHRLVVETIPYFEVSKACGKMPSADRYEACSWTFVDVAGKPVCHIIYPKLADVGAETMIRVIRHETGHCNGWSGKHEGARE